MNVPWRDRRGRFLPFKAAVLASLFVPGVLYAMWLATGELGGRPVMETIHGTGLWAIRLLLISLAITPFARALDWPGLLLVRRNVGVAAACYAVAHLSLYVVDQNFKLLTVVSEIALRFYLTIGFVALLVLLALAVTSTDAWVKKLGRNWKRLHRLAYPLGVVALLHFYIQSKLNVSEPVFVSGLFIWLMAWRSVPEAWRRTQGIALPTALLQRPGHRVRPGDGWHGVRLVWPGDQGQSVAGAGRERDDRPRLAPGALGVCRHRVAGRGLRRSPLDARFPPVRPIAA